ncbi:glycosyltransferase family 2 protein [Paenibacillus melissococcoides]|uniref:Glycosyltransferase family 2 protein n=1 Tax=Paenibacillus melissococcoides TaxID=2912268 RepID=A0ABM9GC03_9BACL|nr:glycosyltransferase family 2 protein [Paenibacillus melissococcoides]CAH8248965.1 glycosyltransferase family 2 protein [Paenibacillus melissococcoides]CAH8720743.1 glycosyltransferase family 2 protein [Paenibacillus melissococcoides]CAH8720908.1 glycosyltransferase family 2 protein [Paenibacillus melissococcoides]
MIDLSIIIVNYNTKQLTLNCIESVYRSVTDFQYEVILIDNASRDDSVQVFRQQCPQVELIANEQNLGFSKANNQGMQIAKGRYVLLLNSDTVIQPDTLDVMIRFMDEHPEVGASGCKVVLPDGSLDKACRRGFPTPAATFFYVSRLSKLFPKNPRINAYHREDLNPDEAYPIDCLIGAFMMVRREAIDQVGMLDEQFFMYGEDVDWCYRIKQAGWVNYYYPKTQIIHYKRASSRNKPYKITYEFHRAIYVLYNKHFKKKYPFWVTALMYAGIGAKLGLAMLMNVLSRAGASLRPSKPAYSNKKDISS